MQGRVRTWVAGGSFVVASLGGSLAFHSAAQAAVTVLERESNVSVFAHAVGSGGFDGGVDSDSESTTTTSSFSHILNAESDGATALAEAEARQNSSLSIVGGSLTGINATGLASTLGIATTFSGETADANATSDLYVRFRVPAGESYDYSVTGDLGTTGTGISAVAYLADVDENIDLFNEVGNSANFAYNGQLGPGDYELFMDVFASVVDNGTGESTFDIQFTLTPVPEPASATALLALGAAGILNRRRRR